MQLKKIMMILLKGAYYSMIKVQFRKYNHKSDIFFLYEIMTNDKELSLFSTKLIFNSIIEFENWLNERFRIYYHEFFIIENQSKETIGFIYSHEYYPNDRHLKISTYVKDTKRYSGYGAIATIKFSDYLFRNYSLNKIFTNVYGYNNNSINNNIKGGLELEGCIKSFRYLNGEYHNLYIY